MTQSEIDQEVAATTGECLADVRRHGFSLWEPGAATADSEARQPLVLNWDTGLPAPWPLN
jgi:hypothetical protein